MQIPNDTGRFTPMQLHLLNMFAKNVSEQELNDIRRLIAKYYADKLSEDLTAHIESQGKTVEEWVEELKHEHLRTPYKR